MLLSPQVANVAKDLPTARYDVKRLSAAMDMPVIFTLRALPYGRVEEIKRSASDDTELQIVLSGVTDPDLKDGRLRERFGGATPAETLKAILLPGEIADLAAAVERLCGYRRVTIDEVKNA